MKQRLYIWKSRKRKRTYSCVLDAQKEHRVRANIELQEKKMQSRHASCNEPWPWQPPFAVTAIDSDLEVNCTTEAHAWIPTNPALTSHCLGWAKRPPQLCTGRLGLEFQSFMTHIHDGGGGLPSMARPRSTLRRLKRCTTS